MLNLRGGKSKVAGCITFFAPPPRRHTTSQMSTQVLCRGFYFRGFFLTLAFFSVGFFSCEVFGFFFRGFYFRGFFLRLPFMVLTGLTAISFCIIFKLANLLFIINIVYLYIYTIHAKFIYSTL